MCAPLAAGAVRWPHQHRVGAAGLGHEVTDQFVGSSLVRLPGGAVGDELEYRLRLRGGQVQQAAEELVS
ncbi:hypothetical protein [Mycobacterium sp. JS623]|uniref:hypothetical protein n=1 Tax=Mycobacterium sp. JS623 TaxID=212767 RepID=UPI0012FB91A2|nr:hypothetical protein [Mycobacterium sp. JS623]